MRRDLSVSRALLICCVSIAWAMSGCGEPPVGSVVKGTVTFNGQPLDQGSIEFSPAAGQKTYSGGAIKDGQYSLPADQGLEPGLYDVRISSTEGKSPATTEMPGEVAVPPKQRIPEEFNAKTTLKVEVKQGAENKFDFTIP
jgi:hypothetical protein